MAASSPSLIEEAVVKATCCAAAASLAPEVGGTAEAVTLGGTVAIATAARAPTVVLAVQANQPDPMLDCFSAAL
eukprot:10427913-Karenia_brevis.AAC.1